jgi:ABC-type glutathione transport system ATPase component
VHLLALGHKSVARERIGILAADQHADTADIRRHDAEAARKTEQTVVKIREIAKTVDVVLIEHDMEVVFAVADEIIVMAQGALLARGTPAEISASTEVQEAYLGAPEEAD